MARRTKVFKELTIPSGFTSMRFMLESRTNELSHRGLLIGANFRDQFGDELSHDEVDARYSKDLGLKYQYLGLVNDSNNFFRTSPFLLNRPANFVRITAVEWGAGFASAEAFSDSISRLWMVAENPATNDRWTFGMES